MGWLVPLAVISPMRQIGGYGISGLEVGIFLWAVVTLFRGIRLVPRRSPLMPYIWLLLLGWILAGVNGTTFGVAFDLWKVTFLYRLCLCVIAWNLGYLADTTIERVASSRVALVMVGGAMAVVILYGVLPYSGRLNLLSLFSGASPDLALLCQEDRFPGLIQNANIYAFFPVCLLVFSFTSFMRKQTHGFIPSMCAVIIFATGSRKSVIFAVVALAAIFLSPEFKSEMGSERRWKRRRNRVVGATAILAMGASIFYLASRGSLSGRAIDKMNRPVATEDWQYRRAKWGIGMDRVAMAPLLGIPEPRGKEADRMDYYIRMSQPHNEFIQIWMWYGLLGLSAHIYLLLALVRRNLRCRTGLPWLLFYCALIQQMLVDTALKDYVVSAFVMMIAGHNWRLMDEKELGVSNPERLRRQRRIPAVPRLAA
jgi:hypothetical protein